MALCFISFANIIEHFSRSYGESSNRGHSKGNSRQTILPEPQPKSIFFIYFNLLKALFRNKMLHRQKCNLPVLHSFMALVIKKFNAL
jgi:hypothetical protein